MYPNYPPHLTRLVHDQEIEALLRPGKPAGQLALLLRRLGRSLREELLLEEAADCVAVDPQADHA